LDPPAQKQVENNTIRIGILSPKEGSRLSSFGGAHEDAIRLAFEREGPIRVGDRQINLQIIGWNDRSDPALAAELALQLAFEQDVAAILGPVNSSATIEVLKALNKADLEIPVMSSQSTAPDLLESGQRDSNFFRLTFDDSQRMAAYATFIEEEKRGQIDQKYLFLYENDVYGRGLSDALTSNFYTSNIITHSWCNAVTATCGSEISNSECVVAELDCNNNILGAADYQLVRTGEYFNLAFLNLIEEQEPQNVVVLGTQDGALAFALGLEYLDQRFDYFLVGNTKEFFAELPAGSMVIGEPLLDPERAPTDELHSQWQSIHADFEQIYARDRADFLSTAYESGMVMHSALRSFLSDKITLPPLDEIRAGLIDVLETQTFDSLEPWRRIRFSDGGLDQPPTAPIYRIARGQVRQDPLRTQEWVEIEVFPQFGYFESPIKAEFTSHSINSATATLSRITDGVAVLKDRRIIDFSAGEAEVAFHVLSPGLYRVGIEGAPSTPAMAETRVAVSPVYFIATVIALIGALIVTSRDASSFLKKVERCLIGVTAGFIFTFTALYGRAAAEWFPFPSFGDEPIVNAVILGLIGGLIGPHLLPEIFVAWGNLITQAIKRPGNHKRRRSDMILEDFELSHRLPNNSGRKLA